jgi:hypothetical protein
MTGTNSPCIHATLSPRPDVTWKERLFTAALRFGQRRAPALVIVFADAAIPTGG